MKDTVTIVFVDRTMQEVDAEAAWTMCKRPTIAGRIVDVLTEDKDLQERYRRRMDNLET